MRQVAKELGYKLSEYGLFKNNEKIEIKSEKDVFTLLKLPYLEPNER
jgi:DNA polymerase (family 10)